MKFCITLVRVYTLQYSSFIRYVTIFFTIEKKEPMFTPREACCLKWIVSNQTTQVNIAKITNISLDSLW